MIEDQVLFHLPKFWGNIFSLRIFPDPLKGHDEAVPQGAGFGSLKSVSTLPGYGYLAPDIWSYYLHHQRHQLIGHCVYSTKAVSLP